MGKASVTTQPQIIIRPEAWGSATDVVMAPPIPSQQLDRDFATVAEARVYASRIAEVHGRVVVDQTAVERAKGSGA